MAYRFWFLFLFGIGGCFEDTATSRNLVLPADYGTSFTQVQTCLPDTAQGHGLGYQVIRANEVAQQGPPYPPGSIFVSERHSDASCASLLEIFVMSKEKPGYNSLGGDWHFQRLNSIQRVLEDGSIGTCLSCHQVCMTSDYLCARR